MNKKAPKIFPTDIMTAQERFDAVIRLEEPDRVPLSLMLYYFAPLYAKVPMSRYMTDRNLYLRVMQQVWKELGPWDLYYNVNPVSRFLYNFVMMMRVLWPGKELPEDDMAKVEELAYMSHEDYDWVLRTPERFSDIFFRSAMMPRFCQEAEGLGMARVIGKVALDFIRQLFSWRKEFHWWRSQGAAIQIGYQAEMPFDTFSQARNVINFSMDLLQRSEKIGQASTHMARSFAELSIFLSKLFGVPTVQCYCHRSSNSFISPEQFKGLALPGMEIITRRIAEAGMTPILHCDGNWMKNLSFMRKRLPAKKIIIQLDGLTDIFKAKEEIGDHFCLFGDVPAAKLVMGSEVEVEEYCHRLIEEVGKGGGFILAGGCEIPPNARPENLQAMVRAVQKYGYYSKLQPFRSAA